MSFALIGLKLLGIGKWLKEAATALFRWMLAHPWPSAVIALLCLSGGLWWHYSGKVEKLTATVSARDKTISDMKAASKQAAKDQAAVNARPAIISGQIAEASNAQSKIYYDEGRRAGIAYADAHRVRSGTSGGLPNNPDLPATDQAAGQHEGGSEAPGMVALSDADYTLLVGNSLRLAQVHEDTVALIKAGVAE